MLATYRSQRISRPLPTLHSPLSTLHSRRAFTLVELLVILTIIAMLVALLVPALNRIRVSAQRSQCMSNERAIGQAALVYAAANHQVLPACMETPRSLPTGAPPGTTIGWVQGLLPQLDHPELAGQHFTEANAPTISIALCPADGAKIRASGGPLTYVVNGGCSNNYSAPEAMPYDWPANGVWNYRVALPGHANPLPHTTSDFIREHDGLSTTISLGENLDATSYLPSSPTAQFQQTILWDPYVRTAINRGIGATPSTLTSRPSSNHPGGAVFCFCDGHVAFINESIDYKILATLMTPDGPAAAPPGMPFEAGNPYVKMQMIPFAAGLIPGEDRGAD